MTETVKTLRDSAAMRWIALLLLALAMFSDRHGRAADIHRSRKQSDYRILQQKERMRCSGLHRDEQRKAQEGVPLREPGILPPGDGRRTPVRIGVHDPLPESTRDA